MADLDSHYWADVITVLHTLEPKDDDTICAIVQMLGHRETKDELDGEQQQVKCDSEEEAKEETKPEHLIETKDSIPQSNKRNPAERGIPSKLMPVARSRIKLPSWLNSPLSLERKTQTSYSISSLPETLLSPNWTRAILSGALSTYDALGPMDIEYIVNHVSRAIPLMKVPKRPLPTMAKGVQVLIDKSEALEPFYRDEICIEIDITKVAGRDRTKILTFTGCPLWGVRTPLNWSKSDYYPPSNGTMVVVVTDVGIARSSRITQRAGISDWLKFTRIIHRAGCSLVALVPYPQKRWPKPLVSEMNIIQWDRKTSLNTIMHLMRKSLQMRKDVR